MAEELCKTAVTTMPTRSATKRFVKELMISTTCGDSLSTDIESDIEVRPRNKTPKPSSTSPIRCIFVFLQNITIITPAMTIAGAKAERLNEINWEVTVVPIFAPIITPAA